MIILLLMIRLQKLLDPLKLIRVVNPFTDSMRLLLMLKL